MCGIAGLISCSKVDAALVRRMAAAIAHRGPDDAGVWIDQDAGVGLGHRRLSIVDLSPSGHQPMISNDGRWVLDYNGEIYNHAAMRATLDEDKRGPANNGVPWRGHSDTETLIECIAAWGLDRALDQAVGMFAFALWDRKDRKLHLVRDRFGEKPLYYGWAAGSFVFASELKAIRALDGFDNAIDRRAVKALAARNYIPAPLSIYKRLFKLPPGAILTADDRQRRSVDVAVGGHVDQLDGGAGSCGQPVGDRLALRAGQPAGPGADAQRRGRGPRWAGRHVRSPPGVGQRPVRGRARPRRG